MFWKRMRLHLLDKLSCPHCGQFPLDLTIEAAGECRSAPIVEQPCGRYCAHLSVWLPVSERVLPCYACLRYSVNSGVLRCQSCRRVYPIVDGIPNFLAGEILSEWIISEQHWWNRHYNRHGAPSPRSSSPRFVEREINLFSPLRQRRGGFQTVLEVGAGPASYVAQLLAPQHQSYLYVGTDIARTALLLGARALPESDFVQCDAGRLPFREASYDIVILLGVLHHLATWSTSLVQLLHVLKPGGWILFDEAIAKPRLLCGIGKRVFGERVDSPHGGEIALGELTALLQRHGWVIRTKVKTTTLRVLLIWLCGPLLEQSWATTRLLLFLDNLFLRLVARYVRRFGPAEAIGIFEKEH